MNFKRTLQTFNDAGYSPTRYSGREMNGRYCVGVMVSRNPFDVLLKIVEATFDELHEPNEGADHSQFMGSLELLEGARTDQLGKDQILYFPGLSWEEEEETEYDDD